MDKRKTIRGLPIIMYSAKRRGWDQASYIFPLRITCKKEGERVQIARKIAYTLNGRCGHLYVLPLLYKVLIFSKLLRLLVWTPSDSGSYSLRRTTAANLHGIGIPLIDIQCAGVLLFDYAS